MDRLWAPWRLEYILGPKPDECIFCLPDSRDDDENRLVLHRGKTGFVVMNRFPYNTGHLMASPYRHVACITELEAEEVHELSDLVQGCTRILKHTFNPDGINIGLNIGEAAGAGIEEHLHYHLVPRWTGDHSFMAVFSQTMVIPEHLRSVYTKLKPGFDALVTT